MVLRVKAQQIYLKAVLELLMDSSHLQPNQQGGNVLEIKGFTTVDITECMVSMFKLLWILI